jgi:hypothetical protein
VALGLAENAVATAILALPFLTKAKALWDFSPPASVMFAVWNKTFDIHMCEPGRRKPPTARIRDQLTTNPVLYHNVVEQRIDEKEVQE